MAAKKLDAKLVLTIALVSAVTTTALAKVHAAKAK